MEYTKEQIEEWKLKAKQFDLLNEQISKFYCNSDDEYDDENPIEEGDLCTIGEITARFFGWL
jgi:hypothetical protein